MWRLLPPLTLTLSPTLSTPSSSLYQYTIRHDYATFQRRRDAETQRRIRDAQTQRRRDASETHRRRDAETQRRIKGGPREAQGRTKGG
jgi:hypothetical protein